MAEVIYRLPGKEQYSYVEVKTDDQEFSGPGGDEALSDVLKTSLAALDAVFPGAQSTGAAQNYQSQAARPQGGSGHTCDHGERVYKTGTSGKGPWAAYMCPIRDKAQQCAPEWVNK